MQSGNIGEGVFAKSAKLLARNPRIVLPGIVFGVIAAAIDTAIAPPGSLESDVFRRFAQDVVKLVAALLAIAYTTGMADAAWRFGVTTLAQGRRALTRPVAIAWLAVLGAGLLAAALSPFTLGLSYFVFVCACIYAIPAAIIGDRGGLAALRESIDMFLARMSQTILIVAALVILGAVMSVFGELIADTPFVGPAISEIVLQAVAAYVTIVIVGEYRFLRNL